jgi:hypothetical protein
MPPGPEKCPELRCTFGSKKFPAFWLSGVEMHLWAEASISRFGVRHGVAAVPKAPSPRASAGPEHTHLRTAPIVNSGDAGIN